MPDVDEAELLRRSEQRAQAARNAEEQLQLAQMREWGRAVYSVLADIRANLRQLLDFGEDSLQAINAKGGKRIGWRLSYWFTSTKSIAGHDRTESAWLLFLPSGAIIVAATDELPVNVPDRELLTLLVTHGCRDMTAAIRTLYAKATLPVPAHLDIMMRPHDGNKLPWDRLGEALGEPTAPSAVAESPASRSRWGKIRRK
jgi:hypothetical protein